MIGIALECWSCLYKYSNTLLGGAEGVSLHSVPHPLFKRGSSYGRVVPPGLSRSLFLLAVNVQEISTFFYFIPHPGDIFEVFNLAHEYDIQTFALAHLTIINSHSDVSCRFFIWSYRRRMKEGREKPCGEIQDIISWDHRGNIGRMIDHVSRF